MGPRVTKTAVDGAIADWVATTVNDPLAFVVGAYPWGEPGPLEHEPGPDAWQEAFLIDVGKEVTANGFNGFDAVPAIRRATSSGHGIGKSALVSWLTDWIMSTRAEAQGSVTANTRTQLRTKTWAAIQWWTALCLTAHWFRVTDDRMYHRLAPKSWFCELQVPNVGAFAGQHQKRSTSFYFADEGSTLPEGIWHPLEGGLTDGEPMVFVFGNCTRNQGTFHEMCFGAQRGKWHPTIIDSRSSRFTNKGQIEAWRQEYGEDSDFFRVRVRGLPPAASDLQFIGTDVVAAAQTRPAVALSDDPLVCGLDLARGGADECVFRFRRGKDARSIPPVRVPGAEARDSMKLVTIAADILGRTYDGRRVAALFVDATGGSIGGPVADRLRQLGHKQVIDVQFGGESPDPRYANMRAYIWGRMRDWLASGGAIDDAPALEQDLTGPGYLHDSRDRLLIESKESMKKRGLDSPDDGDALAETFAQTVSSSLARPAAPPYKRPTRWG